MFGKMFDNACEEQHDTATAADTVNTTVIKPPPFWPADPELWFLQVDALFRTRRITSSITKFNHVVAAISPQIAATVRDLIRRPPTTEPYQALKDALVKRSSPTRRQCLQQLLHQTTLGDRKPSELLRVMRRLYNDETDTDSELLKELFLSRMPKEIRVVLVSTNTTTSLEDLAEMADEMVDCTLQTDNPPFFSHNSQVSELQQLRDEVATLRLHKQRHPGTGTVSNNPHHQASHGFCWYHTRFGQQAQKCMPPCSFAKQPGNDRAGR